MIFHVFNFTLFYFILFAVGHVMRNYTRTHSSDTRIFIVQKLLKSQCLGISSAFFVLAIYLLKFNKYISKKEKKKD